MVRILVVDDDEQVRGFVTATLKRRKYEVTEAASGNEAIRILNAEEPFGVVMSDVNMPDGNGSDVAHEVMFKHPSTRLIMMTGDTGEHNAVLTEIQIAFPSVPILEKPLRPIPILGAVAEAIAKNSSNNQPRTEEEAHG